MAWVSTRWLKLRQRGIAQFVSIAIVSFFGFICTVSASGASFSSNRASVPERLAFASDTALSSERDQTFQTGSGATCPDPNGDPLGPGTATVDLVVENGTCVVNAGTYLYHNINIIKGGTLQFSDANITLNAANIIIENQGTMRAGSVDATGNITPISGPLTIHLYGANQGPGGVGASCKTDAACGIPSDIWKSNMSMKMYPDSCTSTKNIGDSGVDDCFYQYDPMPFDYGKTTGGTGMCSASDGNCGYYGYKVLGVGYGATLQLYGKKGATYDTTVDPTNTGTSWVRLNNCNPSVSDPTKQCNKGVLQPGANTLVLSKPVDWQMNDNIVIGSTDYLPGHAEQVKLSCVNDPMKCPGKMTFTPALNFPHNASVYSLSKVTGGQAPTGWTSVDTRASVALLTRSISIVSDGDTVETPFPNPPTPPITPTTQGYWFGGHMVIRQGFKEVQIQGVEFHQMGQGGKIGHYPVHFHMARKVPSTGITATYLKDNSVWDSMTRWYVLHATQGVLMARNVGYASIGHGYYLEDGTETDNKLYANIGIFARAAVTNPQNPRNVPGILAAPDYPIVQRPPENGGPLQTGPSDDVVPYHTDWDHPTVFWIMNGWNDFENNMADGAGTCGVCYWLLPGINSGGSRSMNWTSYASEQQLPDKNTDGGTTPLQIFTGNSCVSAMSSFLTVANTTACNGVQIGPNRDNAAFPVLNQSAAVPSSPDFNLAPSSKNMPPDKNGFTTDNYYPHVGGGGRFPTRCTGTGDCSRQKICSTQDESNCVITNIDHYTSSFNWQATNFAAIWLRPLWYLFINSALTDVQNGGITFVTGGGYTKSDAINGHWALARKDVFIGNTQDPAANKFASNVGPFNPATGFTCAEAIGIGKPGNYCLDENNGISFALATFANNQRMFSIYDGPAYEDSNAYLDITRASLPNDPIKGCNPQSSTDPSPDHNCANSQYSQAGKMLGMPWDPVNKVCYLPNAAIAWKQPNGFYYPPAFHSDNLLFNNVDIRHFVIEPLFKPGNLFVSDPVQSRARYCTYDPSMFTGFTDIDRQTELNDDDGTLTGLIGPEAQTGLVGSVSVNQDPFFNAPLQTPECLSDANVTPTNSVANPKLYAGTAVTSPYDYVTTVVFPNCAASGRLCPDQNKPGSLSPWTADCTNENCYGVPLYRENLIPGEIETSPMGVPIRLMGQATFQRSSLTVNNGRYYIDTSASLAAQQAVNPPKNNIKLYNVFRKGGSYYTFLLFAKTTTKQTYDIYVGTGFDKTKMDQLWLTRVQLPSSYEFQPPQPFPQDQATYDATTGILTVTMDMSKFPNFVTQYSAEQKSQCQPTTFCQWIDKPEMDQDNCQCASSIFSPPTSTFQAAECTKTNGICHWASEDVGCPQGGCYGFGVKLSDNFVTNDNPPSPVPQNVACLTKPMLPAMSPYDVNWTLTTNSSTCNYSSTNSSSFCSSPTGAGPDDSSSSPDTTAPDDTN
ncbi:G8 domain-containing protein [Candidatus Binatus sp.]|uniref:G8 domain-containing protein n=1 Tax=Candidatus Binatus sp. TaxID=2811406 RepID=UPI003BAE5035